MKIFIDKAHSRGYADYGWLKTFHTFSFANYYNPERVHFGALRVLNDDTVLPGHGFDTHPHKNMEVISIPLKGYLRHGDSMENSRVITPGDIQLMSTGTGIYHSEFNDSSTENLEFLQIWVIPRKNDTVPKYENYDIRPLIRKNEWSLFIAPDSQISILQDAWFSWGIFDAGVGREYILHGKNTGVYLFIIEGEIKIGDITLFRRDGMEITRTDKFYVEAVKKSSVLLIEVALI
ncbi:MAG: pirin family protein [Bacteroidaceae bacterium]|nr:pirin family protein [Bacteroidaceae bacterium]